MLPCFFWVKPPGEGHLNCIHTCMLQHLRCAQGYLSERHNHFLSTGLASELAGDPSGPSEEPKGSQFIMWYSCVPSFSRSKEWGRGSVYTGHQLCSRRGAAAGLGAVEVESQSSKDTGARSPACTVSLCGCEGEIPLRRDRSLGLATLPGSGSRFPWRVNHLPSST